MNNSHRTTAHKGKGKESRRSLEDNDKGALDKLDMPLGNLTEKRKGKGKKMLSNSTRRVSWHSGLDLVDGLGVLGAIRTGNSPLEVPWEILIYINKLSKS